MTRYRLPWLITAVALIAAILSILAPLEEKATVVESRFPVADGVSVRAEYVDLTPTLRLLLRYSPIADDGVELQLIANGEPRWNAYAKPLGVDHSCYWQKVRCQLEGSRFTLRSNGYYGDFTEIRDVATGKLIERTETDGQNESTASDSKDTDSNNSLASRHNELSQSDANEIQRRIHAFRSFTTQAEPPNASEYASGRFGDR